MFGAIDYLKASTYCVKKCFDVLNSEAGKAIAVLNDDCGDTRIGEQGEQLAARPVQS